MKVTASDADDPTYGSSARVVYSVLDGEKIFTVDKHTGKNDKDQTSHTPAIFFSSHKVFLCSFCILQYRKQSKTQKPYFPKESKVCGHKQKINQAILQ